MKRIVLLPLVACVLSLSACAAPQTNREKGTAIGVGVGAATGAILGQAIAPSQVAGGILVVATVIALGLRRG